MPVYEFRCSTCHAIFDERRPMADADAPASCPDGHVGARRLLPVFATTGLAAPASPRAPSDALDRGLSTGVL